MQSGEDPLPYLQHHVALRQQRRAAARAGLGCRADPRAGTCAGPTLGQCDAAAMGACRIPQAADRARAPPADRAAAVRRAALTPVRPEVRGARGGCLALARRSAGAAARGRSRPADRGPKPFTLHFGFDGWQRIEDARRRRSRSDCGRCGCRRRNWQVAARSISPATTRTAGKGWIIA